MKVIINKGRENFTDAANLRQEVFVDEQGFIDEFDELDDLAWHVTLYDGGACVGVGRIFSETDQPDEYHIGRVAIKKECRNQGLGKIMMNELEKVALANKAHRVVLSAQVPAIGFYQSCGYVAEGERYNDQHQPHQKMVKHIK